MVMVMPAMVGESKHLLGADLDALVPMPRFLKKSVAVGAAATGAAAIAAAAKKAAAAYSAAARDEEEAALRAIGAPVVARCAEEDAAGCVAAFKKFPVSAAPPKGPDSFKVTSGIGALPAPTWPTSWLPPKNEEVDYKMLGATLVGESYPAGPCGEEPEVFSSAGFPGRDDMQHDLQEPDVTVRSAHGPQLFTPPPGLSLEEKPWQQPLKQQQQREQQQLHLLGCLDAPDRQCAKAASMHLGASMLAQLLILIEAEENRVRGIVEHCGAATDVDYAPAEPSLPESVAVPPGLLPGPEDFQPRSEGLPSIGSDGHRQGSCKPCLFFYNGICRKSTDCTFCHIPHPMDQIRRVRPSKKTRGWLQRRHTQVEEAEAAGGAPALTEVCACQEAQ